MDPSTIYTKTTRGKRALTKKLPKAAGVVLPDIDGNSNLGAIIAKQEKLQADDVEGAINWLLEGGFIKLVVQDPFSDSVWDEALSHNAVEVDEIALDQFTVTDKTARAKKQSKPLSDEELVKLKALEQADEEAKARAEAALKAKLDTESAGKIESETIAATEESAKKAAEEKRKAEAAEQAKREAEAKAAEEAERKAAELEAKAIAKAEEAARKEAEAKRKAEEKAAEEKRKAEEAEQAKREAEAKAAEEAERKAAELEAKAIAKAEEAARKEAEAKRKAEEKAAEEKRKAEAAEQAKREVEAKAAEEAERKAAELEAKAIAKAEEAARKEAEAKRKAEEKAAEEKRKAEAAEQAKREVEAKAAEEAERKAAELEAKAIAKAEEAARKEAEAKRKAEEKAEEKEKARLEAAVRKEEKARIKEEKRAEAEKRKAEKAEEKARIKEEAAARKAAKKAEADARRAKQNETPEEELFTIDEVEQYLADNEGNQPKKKIKHLSPINRWFRAIIKNIKPLSIYAIAVLFLLIFAVQFINFHIWAGPIERIAKQHIQDDVNMQAVHISYFPSPHLVLEELSIANSTSITAKKIGVYPNLSNLKNKIFNGSKAPYEIVSIHIEGFNIAQKDLHRLTSWQGASSRDQQLKVKNLVLKNMAIQLNHIELPNINGNVQLSNVGELKTAKLTSEANNIAININHEAGRYLIDVLASRWRAPIAPYPVFSELKGKASIKDERLIFSNISGTLYNGRLNGSLNIDLASKALNTRGSYTLNDFFIADMAEELKINNVVEGKLKSKGTFSFDIDKPSNGLINATLASTFNIDKGYLKTVDIAEAMRSGNLSGYTKFTTLSGNASLANQQYRFSNLRLRENQLSAQGQITLSAKKQVSGVISSSISVNRNRINARLNITGPITALKLKK